MRFASVYGFRGANALFREHLAYLRDNNAETVSI